MKRIHAIGTSRVKCLDFHQNQPLLLAALYSGDALIVDVVRGSVIKTYPVHTGVPLRACRWVNHNGNFVVAGDNRSLHFYSPTKGKQIFDVPDAHNGYVRALAVHSSESLLLSSSDDLTIKLWDISTNCTPLRVFDIHSGIVMDVKWNPKEPTSFASCSLDGNVIFWEISSEQPRFTQKIGVKCVNSISFASTGDRPLIAAGSDDKTVQIWDIQSRSLVAKLEAHENNITRSEFHPTRPIIVTTGEDNLTVVWSSSTFKKENSLSSAMERGWALSFANFLPYLAIGHDKGITLHKFKNNGIPMSLDSSGKIVVAKNAEISVAPIKNIGEVVDGSELTLPFKEAITSESSPVSLLHSANGRYIAATGENEWTIYSSLGFKSRAFGKGIMFAWGSNSNSFATLSVNRNIDIHPTFDESVTITVFALKIWGGELLSVSTNNGLEFYDWETQQLIRRIEIKPRDISWYGDLVAVRTKTSIFILQYNRDMETEHDPETGFADAFTVVHEVETRSSSMCWALGILLYSEGSRINRLVDGIPQSTASLKSQCDIIGYLPRENLIILADQRRNLLAANLPSSLLEFEAAIMYGDDPDPSSVPEMHRTKTAKLLKQLGKLELALAVATEPSMKFDIAVELGDLETAMSCAGDSAMWRRLARAALTKGDYNLSVESLKKCGDLSTLLLLLKVRGSESEMTELVERAENEGQLNVAFTAALLVHNHDKCVDLLIKSGKFAEASMFARSNCPNRTSECVKLWKASIPNKRIADSLADPEEFPNLFDELIQQND